MIHAGKVELSTKTLQILNILDEEAEKQELLENESNIYDIAIEKYAYDIPEVDKQLKMLKEAGFVDRDNRITGKGSLYLQQNMSVEKSDENNKEVKKANPESVVKMVTAVVALITAIIGIIVKVLDTF